MFINRWDYADEWILFAEWVNDSTVDININCDYRLIMSLAKWEVRISKSVHFSGYIQNLRLTKLSIQVK